MPSKRQILAHIRRQLADGFKVYFKNEFSMLNGGEACVWIENRKVYFNSHAHNSTDAFTTEILQSIPDIISFLKDYAEQVRLWDVWMKMP